MNSPPVLKHSEARNTHSVYFHSAPCLPVSVMRQKPPTPHFEDDYIPFGVRFQHKNDSAGLSGPFYEIGAPLDTHAFSRLYLSQDQETGRRRAKDRGPSRAGASPAVLISGGPSLSEQRNGPMPGKGIIPGNAR